MDINWIIILVVGFLIIYLVYVYNGLVTARTRISEALAQIDVQLKRRTDLVPNLVETVKGYAKHEKVLLENVTKARTGLMSAKTTQDKATANNFLTDTLKTLFAVSENYPDLKASQNFLSLQEELTDTENKIAYSRQFYNSNVRDYNTQIQVFPNVLAVSLFGFKEADYFEAGNEDRQPVKVSFKD
jgi:LemA protein